MDKFLEALFRGALVYVTLLLVLIFAIFTISTGYLSLKNRTFRRVVLVADGEIIHKNLHALGLDETFVWETIQDLGMEDLSQIDVLEMSEDGSIYLNKKKNL